jgi:hypothetical protein
MLANFKFPVKRKLLIEKHVRSNIKIRKNLFILEFLNSNNECVETFLVYSDTIPTITLETILHNGLYEFNRRASWEEMDMLFLENIGKGKGDKLINWINSEKQKATNIILYRSLSNETKSYKEKWFLYGCLVKCVFDYNEVQGRKEHGLGISLRFNHCNVELS